MAIAKCSHAGCSCLPQPGTYFCNSYCEEVAKGNIKEGEAACGCEHDGCDPRAVHTDEKSEPALSVSENSVAS